MVAGGVGLAPFVTLAEALAARGTPMTLFYGAPHARAICTTSTSSSASARDSCSRPKTAAAASAAASRAPLERALARAQPADRASRSTRAARRR